jgi:hypothetical protein
MDLLALGRLLDIGFLQLRMESSQPFGRIPQLKIIEISLASIIPQVHERFDDEFQNSREPPREEE